MDTLPSGLGGTAAAPWTYKMPIGPKIFDLYPSRGDVTVDAPLEIQSALDGPIQVARFGTLAVNSLITASNRCRGLMMLADTLIMGASGHISMSNKGAAGSPHWVNQNICVPSFVTLTGKKTTRSDLLNYLRSTGYCIIDPNLWKCPPSGFGDVTADYLSWPAASTANLLVASGLGVGAGPQQAYEWNNSVVLNNGITGGAGSYAPGGGASGSAGAHGTTTSGTICGAAASGRGGRANIWGSGSAGGGCYATDGSTTHSAADADNYGWGGAPGQNGGQGAGVNYGGIAGCLFILARNLVLTAGHILSSIGYAGGGNFAYGGSSGGGAICVWSGTISGAAINLNCGGGANAQGCSGGPGAGWSASFASLGW